MLVRVALDCEALNDLSGDPVSRNAWHRALLRLLRQHGVIELTADEEVQVTVKNLGDENLRKLWEGALSDLRWQRSSSPPKICMCRIQDSEQLRSAWGGKADVAVVYDARGQELGIPEGEGSHFDRTAEVEIVRFDCASEAESLRKLQDLASRSIQCGERREAIWKGRFLPLAEHSRRIAIRDRYAGVRLAEHYEGKRTASGLSWFLEQLSRHENSYAIDLIVGAKDLHPTTIVSSVQRMVGELAGEGIEDIKLTVVPDQKFGRHAHDRHIRFGDSFIMWISRGLEIFEEETQTQLSSCHFEYRMPERRQEIRDVERLLRWEARQAGWPAEQQIKSASEQ